MGTSDKTKKGLECCGENQSCTMCPYRKPREYTGKCIREVEKDALARIHRLEYALALMVYQYCQDGDGSVTHLCMEAGERAFEALGLDNYTHVELLEKIIQRAEAEMGANHEQG